jgi:VanZ family protein
VKRTFLAFFPLAVWAAAVLVVGGLETIRTPTLPVHADKVAHFLMYGVGGALAAWAGRIRGLRAGLACLVFVILVGAADELRQATIPTRHGDLWDWVADTAGALFFYFITARILRKDRS